MPDIEKQLSDRLGKKYFDKFTIYKRLTLRKFAFSQNTTVQENHMTSSVSFLGSIDTALSVGQFIFTAFTI